MAAIDYGMLSGMTQEEAIDYLRNLYGTGTVLPDYRVMDDGNGGSNYYSSASPYINDQLGRAYLTDVFDPSYDNGVYGSYWVPYNSSTGEITGDPQFAKGQRSGSWLSEHLDVIGPLSVALMGGFAAMTGGLGGAAGSAGGALSGSAVAGVEGVAGQAAMTAFESAMAAGAGEAAAIAAADAAAAAAGSVLAAGGAEALAIEAGMKAGEVAVTAVANGAAGGAGGQAASSGLSSGIKAIASKLAPSALSALKSLFDSNGLGGLIGNAISTAGAIKGINDFKDVVNQGANDITNVGANYATDIANAGTNAADRVRNTGAQAAQRFTDQADNVSRNYLNLGQAAQDAYTNAGANWNQGWRQQGDAGNAAYQNLGQTGQGRFNALGEQAYGMFSDLGNDLRGQWTGLADTVKADVGEFKPYSITTNIGSTDDKGNFTLNAPNQAINDKALSVADKSFAAADAFDLNNYRQNEYDLMQSYYKPYDARAYTTIEDRLRKQGRLGAADGAGSNPQFRSFYDSLADRDLQSWIKADETAMNRRGSFITQGNEAMKTPFDYTTQGLNMLTRGESLGNTDFNNRLAGARLYSDVAGRGIDAYGNALTSGVNKNIDALTSGVNFANTQDTAGVKTMLSNQETGLTTQQNAENTGIGANLRIGENGLTNVTNLQNEGVRAQNTADINADSIQWETEKDAIGTKYKYQLEGIKTKLGGEKTAITALVNLYRALGGAASSIDGEDFMGTILGVLKQAGKALGMTEDQAVDWIETTVTSNPEDIYNTDFSPDFPDPLFSTAP